jgi:hypothetical protein
MEPPQTEEQRPASAAERAGAVLLAGLALGLGLIAADILSGGRIFRRGCGCSGDDEPGAVTDSGA